MLENTLPFVFRILNLLVMPLWAGLLFFPKKHWVIRAIDTFAGVAALIFTLNLIPHFTEILWVILDPNLDSVSQLFSQHPGAFGAWTHFLIGDLWVGRWIVSDSQSRGVAHRLTLPALCLTLLFGPVGLLTYLTMRTLILRSST